MKPRLAGRTIMITGAAYAGGKETVRVLAAESARIAVCATALLTSRERLADQPGRIVAFRVNMRDPASVSFTLANINHRLGAVDTLVHLAPDRLAPTDGMDPCTAVAIAGMRQLRRVLYLRRPGDPNRAPPIDSAMTIDVELDVDATPVAVAAGILAACG